MSAELLERMLAAWGETHDPALEAAILRLGRSLARVRGPLRVDRERDWHALAREGDAVDVDRLLDVPWSTDAPRMAARVVALGRRAPDPRIGRKLARVVAYQLWRPGNPVHGVFDAAIARAPSPEAERYLAAYRRRYEGAHYAAARAAIAALEPRPAPAELLAEAHAIAGDGAEVAALWAQHEADPDPGRAAVLADALQLAGDPRGELIQLQLAIAAGNQAGAVHRRVALLIETHLDEWCPPLPGIVRASLRFEAGFLVALHAATRPEDLCDPGLRTVEDLGMAAWGVRIAELVERMPRLRRLAIRFAVNQPDDGPFPTLTALALDNALPEAAMVPNLRVLGGRWHTHAAALAAHEHAVALGLDAILHLDAQLPSRRADLRTLIALRTTGPAETRLAHGPLLAFRCLGWSARLWRHAGAADVSWASLAGVHAALDALLDAGLRRFRLAAAPDAHHTLPDVLAYLHTRGAEASPGPPVDLAGPAVPPPSAG